MTQIAVRLSAKEKEQFARIAAKNDITMSQLLRWFIRNTISDSMCGISIQIEK